MSLRLTATWPNLRTRSHLRAFPGDLARESAVKDNARLASAGLRPLFHYAEIVPWGRSFEEYRAMFALSDVDLSRRILGCADGPASFNGVASEQGAFVVSTDPLYALDAAEIRRRIDATYDTVISQTWENREKFVWRHLQNPDVLGKIRRQAMDAFLADYDASYGSHYTALADYDASPGSRRYVAGTLPHLPFRDQAFELALCSHFLFLYSDGLDATFHATSVLELLRVAGEARIFPLLDYNAAVSPHLHDVMQAVESKGFIAEVVEVDYEFQRGGNEMLRCVRREAVGPA